MAAFEDKGYLPRSRAMAAPTMIPGGGEGADPSHPDSRGMDSKTDVLDAGGEDRSSCDSPG
jgi:hypothetical protein